jgi:hypothetical protein
VEIWGLQLLRIYLKVTISQNDPEVLSLFPHLFFSLYFAKLLSPQAQNGNETLQCKSSLKTKQNTIACSSHDMASD